jgi:two-component system, cell cycle sensor histidine kinase and response regulator CckA
VSERLKVLLVEDNQADVDLIREMLPETGSICFGIESVPRLSEALNQLKGGKIDLVLVDLGLPDSQGISTFQTLQKAAPNIPVIVLTGNADQELAVTAVKDGAQDYLVKSEVNANMLMRAARYAIERKRVEEELHVALTKYKTLFDCFPLGINVTDDAGNILETNPTAEKLLGVPHDNQNNRHIDSPEWRIVRPDGTPMPSDEYASVRALKLKRIVENVEMGIVKSDKKTTWINVTSSPLPLKGHGVVITYSDITERKRTEEALRESEERYRTLFDNAKDGIALADAETGRLVECNQAMCTMVERDKVELLGQNQSVLHPQQAHTNKQSEFFIKDKSGENGMIHEDLLISKSGKLIPTEIRASQIQMSGHKYMMGIFRDISERTCHIKEKDKLQAQLLQAQKMEAVGTLAGGVAHDFNNLLTAISGFTFLAMEKIDESNPMYRDLKQVSNAASKAAGVIRQLLLFSRKQHMEPLPTNLNDVISHLVKMIDRLIGEDIVIETNLEKELWNILGDEGNIEQILMNLSVNARDAMSSGGKIFIKTENVTINKEYCRGCNRGRPGRFVCLSVSDTGTGMDKLALDHLFEPFFTTKPVGKGTGLGLSVVFGIVEQHKGWINVYSEPGHGTTFKVYFPSSSANFQQRSKEAPPIASLKGNGERILVVEDQPELRELAIEILKTNGYSVFPASTVKAAMEQFEKENGRFDLVFCDVVLPDATGIQLVEALLKRWEFKVIITSGYTDEKSNWDIIKEKKYRFQHKPYTMHALLQAVKEELKNK